MVIATGFRTVAGGGNFPSVDTPVPGAGIAFLNGAIGGLFQTEVSGSFGTGVLDQSTGAVTLINNFLFNNHPNTAGIP
jgi:hypothetical protein